VVQGLLEGPGKLLAVSRRPAADRGGPADRSGHSAAVQRSLQVPVGGYQRPRPHLCAGSHLPSGHGIDLIVDQDHGHVDVPASGVEQVEASDSQTVPVSGEGDDFTGRLGGLQTDGREDGAAMEDFEDVGVHVNGNPGAAADSGGQGQIVADSLFVHRLQESLGDYPVATSRAIKERKEILPEVFFAISKAEDRRVINIPNSSKLLGSSKTSTRFRAVSFPGLCCISTFTKPLPCLVCSRLLLNIPIYSSIFKDHPPDLKNRQTPPLV
jgi:hypothetical protein